MSTVFDQLRSEYLNSIASSGIADNNTIHRLEESLVAMDGVYHLADDAWYNVFTNGLTPLMGDIISLVPDSVKNATDKTTAWNQVPISEREDDFSIWQQSGSAYLTTVLARYVDGNMGQLLYRDETSGNMEKFLTYVTPDSSIPYYILFIVPFDTVTVQEINVYLGDTRLTSQGGAGRALFKTAGKVVPANLRFQPSAEGLPAYTVSYGEAEVYTGAGEITLLTNGKLCSDDIKLSTNFG